MRVSLWVPATLAVALLLPAAVAAEEWQLIGPPLQRQPEPHVYPEAPLTQWHLFVAYPDAAACRAGKESFAAWMAEQAQALKQRSDPESQRQRIAMELVQPYLRCVPSTELH